jgi:FkbM family methyltransferase
MASVNSKIRDFVKPILFRLMGKNGYKYAQMYGKIKDIRERLVEEKEMELLPFLVKSGDEVIDVGANYAYYIERLSKLVGDTGRVYAFEPIPFTHDVCKMIVNKLGFKNVSLYNLGVADKNGTVDFSVPKLDFGGISAGQSHIADRDNTEIKGTEYYMFNDYEIVSCQIVSLDNHLTALKHVSFVKIDIEGAEFFALQGMRQLLDKFKPVILIEIQPSFLKGFDIDAESFRKYILEDMGYQIYKYNATSKKLVSYDVPFDDDNYILIHKERIAEYNNLM